MSMELPALQLVRHRLLRRARRLVVCPAEADDLVQDTLIAAFEAGRDWHDDTTQRWMSGVLRRRAAFVHRTATRRRARERRYAEILPPSQTPESGRPLPELPPSLRLVARLAAAGCTRDEIAWVLDLAPTALRQRVSTARRRLQGHGAPAMPVPTLLPGPVRRAVLPASQRQQGLGTHDPDGHLIVLGCSHFGRRRQPG